MQQQRMTGTLAEFPRKKVMDNLPEISKNIKTKNIKWENLTENKKFQLSLN